MINICHVFVYEIYILVRIINNPCLCIKLWCCIHGVRMHQGFYWIRVSYIYGSDTISKGFGYFFHQVRCICNPSIRVARHRHILLGLLISDNCIMSTVWTFVSHSLDISDIWYNLLLMLVCLWFFFSLDLHVWLNCFHIEWWTCIDISLVIYFYDQIVS